MPAAPQRLTGSSAPVFDLYRGLRVRVIEGSGGSQRRRREKWGTFPLWGAYHSVPHGPGPRRPHDPLLPGLGFPRGCIFQARRLPPVSAPPPMRKSEAGAPRALQPRPGLGPPAAPLLLPGGGFALARRGDVVFYGLCWTTGGLVEGRGGRGWPSCRGPKSPRGGCRGAGSGAGGCASTPRLRGSEKNPAGRV